MKDKFDEIFGWMKKMNMSLKFEKSQKYKSEVQIGHPSPPPLLSRLL
jgi:hypothetical protein